MRIAYIAPGAAGMYCGNCLRDHALAVALRALGEDVTLVPAYTPLLTDLPQGEEVASRELFFNGIRAYLEQRFRYFRTPRPFLDRLFGSRFFVGLLSRMEFSTDPSQLGDMTVSMLRGEEGNQWRELALLADWLEREVRPEVVHISNVLLAGMARVLKARLGVPVVCSLQSEDGYLERLREPYRTASLELIRERALELDALVAVSEYYAAHAIDRLGVPPEKVTVVSSGVPLDGHEPRPFRAASEGLTIGFLARMAPEKGLDILCDVFSVLAGMPEFSRLRLKAAGYLPAAERSWVAALRRRFALLGLSGRVEFLGTVEREEKIRFLQDVDVLAVPTRRPETKGLFVLEAMASAVPSVVPEHGVFPELIERSGAGLLHEPEDVEDLLAALLRILRDDGLRRASGEAGRRAALERFNSERMARETLELYRWLSPARPVALGAPPVRPEAERERD